MMAQVSLGFNQNRVRGRGLMTMDLVVLLDNGLMAPVVQDPVTDVVDGGGDGHMVTSMDGWGRCDKTLNEKRERVIKT